MQIARLRRRALPIIANGLGTLVVPLLTPVVALLVVRLGSAALWGGLVQALLVIQLAAQLVGWGNREHLLRAFSAAPARIGETWRGSLLTRSALLAGACALLPLLGWPWERAAWAALWLAGQALYQSHDALVAYHKSFGFAALVEIGGTLALAAAVAGLGARLDLDGLVALFALVTLAKALVSLLRFRRHTLGGGRAGFDGRFLREALPFFLLGLSGMLQSRIDLYCAGALLPRAELAHYQVFSSLVIYLQALPNIVLLPFVRALYRLEPTATGRIAVRLALLGLAVVPIGVGAIHLVASALYGFVLPAAALALGGLGALPIYWYLPRIYALYRAGRQTQVLRVNVLGMLVSLALSVALIPPLGLVGAAAASAAGQWAMLVAYRRAED